MSGDVYDIIHSKENEYVFHDNFSMLSMNSKVPLTPLARAELKEDTVEINYAINKAYEGNVSIKKEVSDIREWMNFFNHYDAGNVKEMHKACEAATAFKMPEVEVEETNILLSYHKFLVWEFFNHHVRGKEIVLIDPDIMTVHKAVQNSHLYSFWVYYTSLARKEVYDANYQDGWFEAYLIENTDVYDLCNGHPNAVFYLGMRILSYDLSLFDCDYYGYVLNPDHPMVSLHGIDGYSCGRYYDIHLEVEVVIPEVLLTEKTEDVYSTPISARYSSLSGLYGVMRRNPVRKFAVNKQAVSVIVDPLYLIGDLVEQDQIVHYSGKEYVVRSNDYGAYDVNVNVFFGQKVALLRKMGFRLAWVDRDDDIFSRNIYTVAVSEFDTVINVFQGLVESKEPEINSYYTFKDNTANFAMEDFGSLEDVPSDREDVQSMRIAYALSPNYGYYREYYDRSKIFSTEVRLYSPSPIGVNKFRYTRLRNHDFPVGQHDSVWFLTHSIPYDLPFGYVLTWKDRSLSSIDTGYWNCMTLDSYVDAADLVLEE